jgi:CheY-like chemotaxis protein
MQDQPAAQKETQPIKLIVIVEDDHDIALTLVEMIEKMTPYKALVISDARQALHNLAGIRPDLLLVDYYLPGMNGIQFYDLLQEIPVTRQIPVLFMSANLPELELAQRHLSGLYKPLDLDILLSTIELMLQ